MRNQLRVFGANSWLFLYGDRNFIAPRNPLGEHAKGGSDDSDG
jgi:hypothetical protein